LWYSVIAVRRFKAGNRLGLPGIWALYNGFPGFWLEAIASGHDVIPAAAGIQ